MEKCDLIVAQLLSIMLHADMPSSLQPRHEPLSLIKDVFLFILSVHYSEIDVWTQGLISSHRHHGGPQIEVQQVQFAFCSVFVLHLLLNENILLFSR